MRLKTILESLIFASDKPITLKQLKVLTNTTKGEKIMLAIITKMTLTQVSTWFANARRRLTKDNKVTWSPRNRGEDDDDDDDDDVREDGENDEEKDDADESDVDIESDDIGMFIFCCIIYGNLEDSALITT